jgi:hypothetical protein
VEGHQTLFPAAVLGHSAATDRVCVEQGYSVLTWWNGSFGDSTQLTADQVRRNATRYLRAANIVIRHANSPAVTTVLTTVTLADVFTTAQT